MYVKKHKFNECKETSLNRVAYRERVGKCKKEKIIFIFNARILKPYVLRHARECRWIYHVSYGKIRAYPHVYVYIFVSCFMLIGSPFT